LSVVVPEAKSDGVCAICGAASGRDATEVRGGTIVGCRACGGFTTLPRRSDDELARLYDDDYFEGWLGSRPVGPQHIAVALADHDPRAAFVTALGGPGRLLDVGAATGLFLECVRRRGWEVEAIEPSATSWAWATEHFPLPQASPSLSDVEPAPRFDVVCFWHSLEHFAEPVEALARAAAMLNSGGVIVVECPNASSLDRRVRRGRWSGWHLPFHTVHFTATGLRSALEALGLEVEPVRHALWPPVAALVAWTRRLPRGGGDDAAAAALPFLLRQDPCSLSGRVARVLSGREMLVLARRP